MLNMFVERYHSENSLFHLPHGEISITLINISCSLHLLIRGKLLDHGKINKYDALELMVYYMGVDLEVDMKEFEAIRGAHFRFRFLENMYIDDLLIVEQASGDDKCHHRGFR